MVFPKKNKKKLAAIPLAPAASKLSQDTIPLMQICLSKGGWGLPK